VLVDPRGESNVSRKQTEADDTAAVHGINPSYSEDEFGMPESEMIGLKTARKADNYSTWILFCLGNLLFGSLFESIA
jgi:hypothetical protein